MARKPVVTIVGPSGGDLVARLGQRLISVTITDQDGAESDELVFSVSIRPPFPAGPPKGTKYLASVGWDRNGMRLSGVYTVQNHNPTGDPESGYRMNVHCRASDFVDTMKQVDSEHFDEMTAGQIFQKVAGAAGMTAVVDPELAAIQLPYRLRWQQSRIDFCDELARELGGTMKPAGGKLVVMKRGGGRAAGGSGLPAIVVPFSDDYGFDLQIESRGAFKDIAGSWFDPVAGIEKIVKGTSIGKASRFLPVHPYGNEDLARRGGEAFAREQARKTVSGSFDMAGRPDATAEAPVKPKGYGSEIDALDLVASCVTHEITFDDSGGWVTTVEVENREGSG